MKRTLTLILIVLCCWQLHAEGYRLYQVSNSRYASSHSGMYSGVQLGTFASPSAPMAATLPAFSFGSRSFSFGSAYIPQSQVYTPFSNEGPSMRRAPGGGHSGGTDVERPGLPLADATVPMLILLLIYLIAKSLCSKKRSMQQ